MVNNEFLIPNRVASSGLITLDPENFRPKELIGAYDLKQNLYMEQILREKDFRQFLASHDWTQYRGKHMAVFCSVDAIIPLWAYMLVAGHLQDFAKTVHRMSLEELETELWLKEIDKLDTDPFLDKRVVVKGCGDNPIPEAVYLALTLRLKPIVKSLMYGEPCSTVPLFKKAGTLLTDPS